ncbi:1034_t:CDS:1, partial [Gigaspora margarita]
TRSCFQEAHLDLLIPLLQDYNSINQEIKDRLPHALPITERKNTLNM